MHFSLIKIQCLLVSRAEDSQIQGIWVRLPSKPDAIDRNRTYLFTLSLSNSRRVTWKTFVCPQPLIIFWLYHFPAPWMSGCDPDSIAKDCNNGNLKITPSEPHTVGTRLVQTYFWLFCCILFYRIHDLWQVKKWGHFHKVLYQCSISKAACQQVYFGKGKSRGLGEHTGAILTASCLCY